MAQAIPDFEINELVRVRSWEDMAAEFGLTHGSIYGNDNVRFGENETWQCGMEFTVARIEWWDDHYEYYPSLENKALINTDGSPWLFSGWMLEPADGGRAKWRSPDAQAILDLLEVLEVVA